MDFLKLACCLLFAALVAVPLSKRLGLGAVLGYLLAGIAVGPAALGLVPHVEDVMHVSELGVVFLLFLIGLELEPRRLWALRRMVFGLGAGQVAASTALLGGLAMAVWGGGWSALLVGFGLAASSTAFVLTTLQERGELVTPAGQGTFGILLFQDLAVIPLLVALPLVAGAAGQDATVTMVGARALGVLVALALGARFLLQPLFTAVAATKTPELMTAAALLVVVGTSFVMARAGLSMSLGAFTAGVILANSPYRHELEANIQPFKGLFMGLFFMAVGMSMDVAALGARPLFFAAGVVGLMAGKAVVLHGLGRVSGYGHDEARSLAVNLCQGGEFAFVLFAMAAGLGVLPRSVSADLMIIVTLSMALAPVIFQAHDRWRARCQEAAPANPYDRIDQEATPVIIAGFGRYGQIIARLLRTQGIRYTALEKSPEQVDFVRRFGNKLYYGDASNPELLRAAKADKASVLVVAIDDVEESLRTVRVARRHFPHLRLLVRARNRGHAFQLLDLGVEDFQRETFHSSLASGKTLLTHLGIAPERAERVVALFRKHDEETILQQHAAALHLDPKKMQEAARQQNKLLEDLLRIDEEAKPAAP